MRRLSACKERGEAVFITKPSIAFVRLQRGRVLRLTIPPSSIAVSPEVPESCGMERADYVVAEDAWVDGKRVPRAGDVARRGARCLLADSIEEVFGSLSGSGRCYVSCGGSVRELVESLLNPLVCDLSTLSDVGRVEAEGFVSTLWPSHPVLYGLDTSSRISLALADIGESALRHYAKPLAYLDGHALLYEVPYSGSILLSGFGPGLLEMAVRAVLYSC